MTSQVEEQTKKRLNALRNIQLKIQDVESNFYEELFKLEKKFASIYEPLYDQRANIISGKHEPTDEEATWPYINIETDKSLEPSAVGLENFWLEALKSMIVVLDKIQEYDEPILKHLIDIRCRINDHLPVGYTLEFHFSENEYFTNKVLSKSFEHITQRDKDYPFKYETVMLYKSIGTQIDWKEGKNVTVKITKKKQTNKNDPKNSRIVIKEEKQDSFFMFFDTRTNDGVRPMFKKSENKTNEDNRISRNEDADAEDENLEIEQLFEIDYEVGQMIKESVIPKAVLYVTGEMVDNNGDFEEDDDDDEEDGDEDDDDNDEEEQSEEDAKNANNPRKKNKL
jgi:hypothetical protein